MRPPAPNAYFLVCAVVCAGIIFGFPGEVLANWSTPDPNGACAGPLNGSTNTFDARFLDDYPQTFTPSPAPKYNQFYCSTMNPSDTPWGSTNPYKCAQGPSQQNPDNMKCVHYLDSSNYYVCTWLGDSPYKGSTNYQGYIFDNCTQPTPPTLTLTKNIPAGGTITSNPAGITCGATCSATYTSGTSVTLSVVVNSGYAFSGWSGGGCSGTGVCTVIMNADTAVTASFTLNSYTLIVSTAGTGSGTVTGAGTYAYNTVVPISATPSAGSTFTGWSGDADCTDASVTMTANKTCTANFALVPIPTLTLTKNIPAGGTITSTPAGIACGATCSATYTSGTSVTLSAVVNSGYAFSGWSGGGCSGTGACTVTMNADTAVTASFSSVTYAFTVTTSGTGTGNIVFLSPAGTPCGMNCIFSSDTSVIVAASPSGGSTFGGWSAGTGSASGCTGTGSCAFTITANSSVTANFTLNSYILAVNTAGTGSGTVTGAGTYAYNTVVPISATPAAGSTFTGWSGDADCTDTSVTMTANKTCTANFAATNALPIAVITMQSPTSGDSGFTVSVSGSTSYDTDGSIVQYIWNWGDGSAPASGPSASHTYTAIGSHQLTLTVIDDKGGTGPAYQTIMVNALPTPLPPPPPTAGICAVACASDVDCDPNVCSPAGYCVAQGSIGSGPVRDNGSAATLDGTYISTVLNPATLPSGTTSVVVSLTTDVNAQCQYATQDVPYGSSQASLFVSTGLTSHSVTLTGLGATPTQGDRPYVYYVRCKDTATGDVNTSNPLTDSEYPIRFTIGGPTLVTGPSPYTCLINQSFIKNFIPYFFDVCVPRP